MNEPGKVILYLDPTQDAMHERVIGAKVIDAEALLRILRSEELTPLIAKHRDDFLNRFSTDALKDCVRAAYGRRDSDPSRHHPRLVDGVVEMFLRPSEAFESGLVSMRLLNPLDYLTSLERNPSWRWHTKAAAGQLAVRDITHVVTDIRCDGKPVDELRRSCAIHPVDLDDAESNAIDEGNEIKRRFRLVADIGLPISY